MKLEFVLIHDTPRVYTEYVVRSGHQILGSVYKEHDVMTEWGIDANLEAEFGENAASGHRTFYKIKQELERLAADRD